jgi:hypothetical protein
MGCPFVFPSKKNHRAPLEILKHCIKLNSAFWDVCAFFSAVMFSLLGWQQQRKYQRHFGSYID